MVIEKPFVAQFWGPSGPKPLDVEPTVGQVVKANTGSAELVVATRTEEASASPEDEHM